MKAAMTRAGMCIAVSLVMLAGTAGATTFTVTDLGTLGGTVSYGAGINDSGQVTGQSSTGSATHAFLSDGSGAEGSMTDLGTFGGT